MYCLTGAGSRRSAGRGVVVLGVGVAQEVPRRIDEGIHGVRLAASRAAARTCGRPPQSRPPPRGTSPSAGSRRSPAAAQVAGRPGQARRRTRRSARPGSGSPSTAAGTAASRAGGSRSSLRRARARPATAVIALIPSGAGEPGELTLVDKHLVIGVRDGRALLGGSGPVHRRNDLRISRSYFSAKAWSRSSCAATAMIAPSPPSGRSRRPRSGSPRR